MRWRVVFFLVAGRKEIQVVLFDVDHFVWYDCIVILIINVWICWCFWCSLSFKLDKNCVFFHVFDDIYWTIYSISITMLACKWSSNNHNVLTYFYFILNDCYIFRLLWNEHQILKQLFKVNNMWDQFKIHLNYWWFEGVCCWIAQKSLIWIKKKRNHSTLKKSNNIITMLYRLT
jgi:hypothetical protein